MQFAPPLLFAQAISPNTTQLEWLFSSLGSVSSLLVLLSAALILVGACYLVATRRPASVLAAYLVLLPLPSIISVCGWMKGSIASLAVIAATPNLTVTSADIAGGLAASLFEVLVAIMLSAPTYFILAFGLLSRTLRPPTNSAANITDKVSSPSVSREPIKGTTVPAMS